MALRRSDFQVNTEYSANTPSLTTVRLIAAGTNYESTLADREMLVAVLKEEAIAALIRYRSNTPHPWSRTSAGRVRGLIQGVNLDNASSNITAHSMTLNSLNVEVLDALMDAIHESNLDIDLLDIEWSFIFDARDLVVGGAQKVKTPSWAPLRYKETWQAQVHPDGTPLNCAAFALVYMKIARPDKNKHRILEETKLLMSQLHWGETILLSDLETYVKFVAKNKRLTVLLPRINHQSGTTFYGPDFVYEEGKTDNLIYLVYDVTQEHFAAIGSPAALFNKHRSSANYRFCHKCLTAHTTNRICACNNADDQEKLDEMKRQKRLKTKCEACGLFGQMCDDCAYQSCKFCGVLFNHRKGTEPHRCLVLSTLKKVETFWEPGDLVETNIRKTKYKLWAYDLESGIQRFTDEYTLEFPTDENGSFIMENGKVKVHRIEKAAHIVNLVVFRNVFEPTEEKVFFGHDGLKNFVTFMLNHNHGKNICVAHNGSGYDTRLVFEEAIKLEPNYKIIPTARGCKFMQIKVGKTIFRDSMLHIRGSLANLAKDFFGDLIKLRKGHFPHLFNTIENYDYNGPLPDKSFFDLSSIIRNKDQLVEFNAWYHERSKHPWHFQTELIEYCKNDVLILAELMKQYHTILVDKFKMSPWFHATAPSFVHQLVLKKLGDQLEIADPKTEPQVYREQVSRLAWEDYWAVLTPNEYWFARRALRGGRTEVRKIYHQVEPEEWDRGVRIRYQDIVSMYPFVQVAREYPVGLPTIEVYDSNYFPCYEHKNPVQGNVVCLECFCSLEKRKRYCDRWCRIVECETVPTVQEILADESFFGLVCASLTPPRKLFHPVLVTWDDNAGKCIASLEPIRAGVFTTPEFKLALKKGYRLDKLHRLDRYHKKQGLWNNLLKDLYIEKMANSEKTPDLKKQNYLEQEYETRFGMGDAVQESFSRWGNNPAKKQTFKILLNSGWGKHAQRPIMSQGKVIDAEDTDEMLTVFKNVEEGTIKLEDFANLGNNKTYVKHSSQGDKTNPNLHNGYLPAAVFVPAYGRLMLYEQLDKLGKRVLMHDTDSIVYLYDPEHYNIPEGDVWGEWSVEKFDTKNGGIKTFIGLGPKSYALEGGNGKTMLKCKGVNIKLAHQELLNFDIMKKLVLDFLYEKKRSSTFLPQVNFVYRFGRQMVTWKCLKEVSFRPEDLKGYLHEDGVLYPHRYCLGCILQKGSQRDHSCLEELPPYQEVIKTTVRHILQD
jgi:hypothetical protein